MSIGRLGTLRRHATTLVLVAAAVGVGAYALIVDREATVAGDRKLREGSVFPVYRRDAITLLELVHGDETTVLCRDLDRGADASVYPWRLTSPREEAVEAAAVEKIFGALEFASVVRKVDGDDPAFGFATPRARGALAMGKTTYRFAVGAPAPAPAGAAYLRVDGEGTYVVTRDLVTELLKPASAYRERALVPVARDAVTRIELGDVTLDRMDATSFRAGARRAARDATDRALAALGELRAESFLPDATRAAGDVARVRVTAGGVVYALEVGGACPSGGAGVVAARSAPTPAVACVPQGAREGLAPTPGAVVDAHLFAARDDEVAEVRLERLAPASPSSVVDFARKASGWAVRAPDARDLPPEEADATTAFVAEILGARGEPDGAETAFAPALRATIGRVPPLGDEVVEVAAPLADGAAIARRVADGARFRISASDVRLLTPHPNALRRRALFEDGLDKRTILGVSSTCGTVTQAIVRKDGVLTMMVPAGYRVDGAAVLDVASTLLHARAVRWLDGVSGAEDPRFVWKPRGEDSDERFPCAMSVTLEGDGGVDRRQIEFGVETDGGYLARLAPDGAVFVAATALGDVARRLLIDRHVFHMEASAIGKVTITRAGRRVVLDASSGVLAFPDGGRREQVKEASRALESLRADEVLHIGRHRPGEGLETPSLDVVVQPRADAGVAPVHFVLGATGLVREQRVVYARAEGVDATFVIARERVEPLFALSPFP